MTFQMRMRVADWHGNQAANAYMDWQRTGHDARSGQVADKLWCS